MSVVRTMTDAWYSKMDAHYPHGCINCKKEIYWKELVHFEGVTNAIIYWNTNIYYFLKGLKRYSLLKRLWKQESIQFLCCSCYNSFDSKVNREDMMLW